MGVYVDQMRASVGCIVMCHMIADSMTELLEMADKIGIDRKWFQPFSHPHFDVCLTKRRLAMRHGAREVSRKELVQIIKSYRVKALSDPDELALIRAAGSGHPLMMVSDA